MKVLVAVDVVQRETGCTEAVELRFDLRLYLPLDLGQEEKRYAKTDDVTRKSPIGSDQIWNLPRRKNWITIDQGEVQPDAERRQAACPLHRVRHCRCANHQARRRKDAAAMALFDRFVHRHRGTEVVGCDDQLLQLSGSCCHVQMPSRRIHLPSVHWLSIVHGLQQRVYSLSRQVEDARYRRLDSVGTRAPLVSLGVVQEMRVGCCFPVDPRPPSVQHPLQAFPDASKETPASGELSWFKSRLAPVANSQTHPGGRTMTIDRMTLKALIEKGSDDDLLREMVGSVANG